MNFSYSTIVLIRKAIQSLFQNFRRDGQLWIVYEHEGGVRRKGSPKPTSDAVVTSCSINIFSYITKVIPEHCAIRLECYVEYPSSKTRPRAARFILLLSDVLDVLQIATTLSSAWLPHDGIFTTYVH